MTATILATRPAPEPPAPAPAPEPSAVLVQPCDGYPRGTTGRIVGRHQGCVVFAPDRPEAVARWATPRTRLAVPASFIAA